MHIPFISHLFYLVSLKSELSLSLLGPICYNKDTSDVLISMHLDDLGLKISMWNLHYWVLPNQSRSLQILGFSRRNPLF